MSRNQLMLTVLAIGVFSTAGCSGNNRAGVNERYQDNARPIGYYSNESHPNQRYSIFNDNDGPITELLDHTFGAERGNFQNQRNIPQAQLPNVKPPVSNEGYITRNTSYTGNVNQTHPNISNDANTLGKISDQIRIKAATVKNVKDVRAVVSGSSVLINVQLKDKSQAKKTIQDVMKAVQPYADGRTVTVITDKGIMNKTQNKNTNNLR